MFLIFIILFYFPNWVSFEIFMIYFTNQVITKQYCDSKNSKIIQIRVQTIFQTIASFYFEILKLLLLCMAFLKPTFFSCNWKSSEQVWTSVQPKPGFGIGNRNQDQVSVSVSGPELFLPKPKLSPILRMYQKIISVMTWKIKSSI